jgi:hypothetical protein
MNLIDRVRKGEYQVSPVVQQHIPNLEDKHLMAEAFEVTVPINVQNVADWVTKEWRKSSSSSGRGVGAQLLGSLHPLFGLTWFEWQDASHRILAVFAIVNGSNWKMTLFREQGGVVLASHTWSVDLLSDPLTLETPKSITEQEEAEIHVLSLVVFVTQALLHCDRIHDVEDVRTGPQEHPCNHGVLAPSTYRTIVVKGDHEVVPKSGAFAYYWRFDEAAHFALQESFIKWQQLR